MNKNKLRIFWLRIFLTGALVVSGIPTLFAAVPDTINYQGYLTDNSAVPLEGSQLVNFSLYDDATAGSLVWSEQQTVTVTSGIFNVQLGAVNSLSVADFEADLYLAIEIFVSGSGWELLTPRQKLTSTAFAMLAGNADTLEGHAAADFSPAGHDHDSLYVNEGQADGVTSFMIADGTITAADLAANSVGASEIAAGAVGSSEIADGSVTSADLATDSVTADEIAKESVGTTEIIDGSVTAADLAAGSVGSSEVIDNSLTAADLASNSVTAAEIAASAVGSSEIADGTVTAADLADDYVNTSGDTMTGDLNLNAALNVSSSSTSSTDYAASFESSGGEYAYAIKGIANSANFSARGLLLDVDTPNSVGYGIMLAVDAPGSEAYGLDLSVNCLGTNCIGVDSGAYSSEGFAQGMRINATAGEASDDGTLGINANVSNYGTGYLHGLDIDADHYGTTGVTNGIYILLSGSDNGDAKGVYVESNKNSSDTGGTAYGGHFIAHNDRNAGTAYGVYGDAYCEDASCYGVYGKASQIDNDYVNYGVYAYAASASSAAYGLHANVSQSTVSADTGYAGYFYAYSSSTTDNALYGVRSYAQHYGTDGTTYGGSFYATPSDNGDAYGISVTVSGVTTGDKYAGSFTGDVQISGTLSKSGGSFKIDHPLDPENKYLQHSFVESPDMMNVYNGNVLLDENGEAWVDLPEYFDALNRDFRYQLTAIGAPGPNLYIAEKIEDNRFKIAGGVPDQEVSWQVTGIRQDAWAEANPIEVELDKNETDKGFYIHPELYGRDMKSSVAYARDPEMMEEMLQAAEK